MQKNIMYVKGSNLTAGDGKSWDTAFRNPQEALLLAVENSGTEIWVAEGTYLPTEGDNREISFVLKTGVALYGGFKGNEKLLWERNWKENATILSGEIGKNKEDIFTHSYHVVVGADNAIMDGFIIEKGAALPERFDLEKGAPPPPADQGGESGRNGNQFQQTLVKVSPAAMPGSPMRIIHDCDRVAGGGIYMVQGSPIVRNCIVRNNIAMKAGGIFMMSTTELPPEKVNVEPYLENVTVINNRCYVRGGGICCDMLTHPTYVNCKFIDNFCDAKGGGVYTDFGCNPIFVNCLIAKNSSERAGGCGNDGDTNPKYLYCTFTENKANDVGSAMYNGTYGANMAGEMGLDPNDETQLYSNVPYLYKTIVVNNKSEDSTTPCYIWHDSAMQVNDSIVEKVDGEIKGVVFKDPANNDFNQDPTSKYYGYGYDENRRIEDAYRILAEYKRITAMVYPYHYTKVVKGANDPDIIYVNAAAKGDNSGSSWANANPSLATVVKAAKSGQSIWVAKGKYLPTDDANRETAFILKEGVKLYGGFSGSETTLEERDFAKNETILSGDIGKGNKENNSYHILIGTTEAVLDGFTVSDGYANGSTIHQRGAGLLCYFGDSPIINNCIFKNNYATEGAGIGCYKKTKPVITNTLFINNTADFGAACLIRDGADAKLKDCTFKNNHANDRGAAAYIDYGACPEFTNCVFEENTAIGNGGAIHIDDIASQVGDTSPCFYSCTFKNNSSKLKGGAMSAGSFSTYITLKDCKFIKNKSVADGGAIFTAFQVVLKMKDNIFESNVCEQNSEKADISIVRGCSIEQL